MRLATQKQLQRASRSVKFCYLCGDPLSKSKTNRDHVIAKSLVCDIDPGIPLVLPTHIDCHDRLSVLDGCAAELTGFMHGRIPHPQRRQLTYVTESPQAVREPVVGVTGIAFDSLIMRWLQGSHASLYGEFLPRSPATHLTWSGPFPTGTFDLDTQEAVLSPRQMVHPLLVECIRFNRQCDRIDAINIYNGQFQLDCVWSSLDDGTPCCVFAINLCDWKELGRTPVTSTHGCVGLYVPPSGRPSTAAVATKLIGIQSLKGLDPFEP
ncbi:MAG: hypothetical protein KF768_06385 [Phycisphaeraceae bacterium]|nr:hypothetical protein [Phycisphaeraceae bacterium]